MLVAGFIRFGRKRLTTLACALLSLVLLAGSESWADDRGQVLRVRAETLATDGRCEEALDVLVRARAAAPRSARLLLLTAQCQIQLERYNEAGVSLAAAETLDPTLVDLDLHIAIVRFHRDDMVGAYNALDAARGNTNDLAQFDLYLGLVLLQRAEAREAALAFERARRENPLVVEPVASYYAGLAWDSIDDLERAQQALRRVKDYDPDGTWARKAEEALARAEGHRSRPWQPGSWRGWGSLTAGLEYDSNVVLRGSGVDLVDVSRESDGLGVWFLEGGVEAWRSEKWSGGLMVSYMGNAHFELRDFDTHAPVGTLWVDRVFGKSTRARLRVDAGYAWVDSAPFVSSQNITTTLYHDWGSAGSSELAANVHFNQFRFDVSTPPPFFPEDARNRDGTGLRVGLEHTYPLGFLRSAVRAGYVYQQYWSDGTDWDYQGHEFRLGYDATLPGQVRLNLLASYRYLPFDNISSFIDFGVDPVEPRQDDVFRLSAVFERPINRYLSGSVRYTYTLNDSNVHVFNYDRHVVGGYLTVYLR